MSIKFFSVGILAWAFLVPGVQAQTAIEPENQLEPLTLVSEIAQLKQKFLSIIKIVLNPTEAGLEVILESSSALTTEPSFTTQDKTLIIDIPQAVLNLPDGKEFRVDNPDRGIAQIEVTQLDASTIRIVVTGEGDNIPAGTILSSGTNLVLNVTSTVAQTPDGEVDEEIELVVTDETEKDSYFVPQTSTATRTETPIIDIPQSIGIVSDDVIQDRGIVDTGDAVQNISGVNNQGSFSGYENAITIRGFFLDTFQGNYFRDGTRQFSFGFSEIRHLDSIEVLKGPASMLFGQAQPGGIINFSRKQPLVDPYYAVEASIGNYATYSGSLDFSGPLNTDETVLYRLNIIYDNAGSFREFVESERFFISPIITWQIAPNTKLTLDAEFLYDERTMDDGIVAIGDRPADVPISRFLNEPFSEFNKEEYSLGVKLEHDFTENWSLKTAFRAQWIYPERFYPFLDSVDESTGEVFRTRYFANGSYENYVFQTDVIGKFATGKVNHELLLGLEYNKTIERPNFGDFEPYASINLFNPIYINEPYPKEESLNFFRDDETTTIGLYIQDQIELSPHLILVVGGRYDVFQQDRSTQDLGEPKQEFSQSDSKFSPRIGIVYKPADNVSLYASYIQSFRPTFGTFRNFDESSFEPETATQYEVGVKAELLDRKLGITFAAFHLAKQNVVTEDPNDPNFSIQTGEQTSKGLELDVVGEILPGWKIIASAAYIDAHITEDNTLEVGNFLDNVPEFSASLWTTYEIQSGDLEGLGFGLGFYHVGDRYGDLDNSFILPSYFRTDAALYYKRDNWKAQINIRNLFDVQYFTGSAGSRVNIQPGEPFTILGTLAVEF